MRYPKYSLSFILLLSSLIITSGGCTAMMHDSLVNKQPDMVEVLKNDPAVSDNMARVVLYYPRDFAIGIGGGGMAFKKVKIQGNAGSIAFDVLDQCGCYIDIPGGNYEFNEAPNQKFTFQNGHVYYIKIGKEKSGLSLSSMGGIKPTPLDASTALSEMAK